MEYIFEKGPVELGPDELSCLNIIQKSCKGKEDIESKSKVVDQHPKTQMSATMHCNGNSAMSE